MRPKQQHFGLGRSASVDVQITWPGGEQQVFEGVAGRHSYLIQQGRGIIEESDGAARESAKASSQLDEHVATLP
jgi:hypothetical protein